MNNSSSIDRRSWLAGTLGLLAAAAAPALTGCGAGGQGGAGGQVDTVEADVARAAADPTAVAGAVTAMQDFGAAAFSLAAADGGHAATDLVLSPASIHLALGMTLLGARGGTATEMLSALHASDAVTLARGHNAVSQALDRCQETVRSDDGHSVTVRFALADALWGQRGITWAPAFLEALATQFGAAMHVVDYERGTESARAAINGWVGDVTRRTIPELIGPGVLDASTRLTLVNALYLKAPWASPFEPSRTAPGPFTRARGEQVRVPFMQQNVDAGYADGDGWRAVRLDYAGRLALTLVLPDPGNDAFMTTLDGARLRAVLGATRPAMVDLTVPKWRTRSSLQLNSLLSRLGMPSAFTDAADFGGMTTDARLGISAVVHQAYLAVDEAGTEASAATAVVVGLTAAPQQVRMTFDRPFLYVLHDRELGVPLFIGRVGDPSA